MLKSAPIVPQNNSSKEEKMTDYPVNPWKIIEKSFSSENTYRNETIFALANGYIGMRGNFEEAYHGPKNTSLKGTYLNGFYESEPIQYGETAYGYAKNNQTMLNVTDAKNIQCFVDGEMFDLFSGKIISYERSINLKEGVLKREIIWESIAGKQVELKIERLVSLVHQHVAAIHYSVKPLNFSGDITIVSLLDGCVTNLVCEDDPRVGGAFNGQVLKTTGDFQSPSMSYLKQKTSNTRFQLICASSNELKTASTFHLSQSKKPQELEDRFNVNAEKNVPITLTKTIVYHTSRDFSLDELEDESKKALNEAVALGFDALKKEQREYLDDFWRHSDIEIEGDPALQQGLRFNQFHLLQSVGKDGRTNIASKGLTGEGYEGHYFWDTESFVLPFFVYTKPDIAKSLLLCRYQTLDKARARAREMGHAKGALFPWRTINGEECSAYYPAGTAQYHINADVAHALKLYVEASNNTGFLVQYGAEMLFETARFWASLGAFIPAKNNQFCINCVTGPDEYTAIVNNNFYTNMMAKMNLQFAYDTALLMEKDYVETFRELKGKINLDESEIDLWKKSADAMYLPYDEALGIHPQDDTFLSKEVWDFESTPKENYPLLLHYHPLVIYRHQVCKQADVVLADFWFGNKISLEDKKRDYDYYEAITTHDSSLSPCSYSILANEVGYHQKAYDYFMQTARLVLDDLHHNTKDGIHAANMAGAWMSMAFGFAGMRVYDGQLSFNPTLPEAWKSYKLRINFKGRLIEVSVRQGQTDFSLIEGEAIDIMHADQKVSLSSEEVVQAT